METIMRYVLTILVITFFITTVHGQSVDKVSPPFITPQDTVKILPFNQPSPTVDIPAVPIPMYNNPSVDAKMLVWWPDTGIDYKMPNLLAPKKRKDDISIWNWDQFDEKGGEGEQ